MSVAVVIPAYNAGAFIDEAVHSVLVQDRPVDEIIVVNDGSSDRDYRRIASLADRIQVFDQPNRGVSAARNRGCQLASSQYVAILDADDVWLPGKLRAQMTHLEANPSCDAIFCKGLHWPPNADGKSWPQPDEVATPIPPDAEIRQLHYSDFLFSLPVASSTMLIKKSVWLAIGGFDESRRYAEDQDFNLRLSYRHRVDLVDAAGMLYRQHPASATRRIQDANHWADAVSRAAETLGLDDGPAGSVDPAKLRKRLAMLHFFHGHDHFWRGDVGVARREFFLALEKGPLDPKTVAYLLLSGVPGLPQLLRRAITSRAAADRT